jgi:hypothetical protein
MSDYHNRRERHKFIADKFHTYLQGTVLNIGGGGEKHLLKYLKPTKYLELDMDGKPDLRINLDVRSPMPIESEKFDAVICTDVLEHLEEFHHVFEEIIRISKKYVVISVPNALITFRNYARRRKYKGNTGDAGKDAGLYAKFYGLPMQRPKDRHRWFFSYTEAETFFHYNASLLGYEIIVEHPIGEDAHSLLSKIARHTIQFICGKEVMKDWFYSTYWCVLDVKSKNK